MLPCHARRGVSVVAVQAALLFVSGKSVCPKAFAIHGSCRR